MGIKVNVRMNKRGLAELYDEVSGEIIENVTSFTVRMEASQISLLNIQAEFIVVAKQLNEKHKVEMHAW